MDTAPGFGSGRRCHGHPGGRFPSRHRRHRYTQGERVTPTGKGRLAADVVWVVHALTHPPVLKSSPRCFSRIAAAKQLLWFVGMLATAILLGSPFRARASTVHCWYSPAGTGNGSSRASAAKFSPAGFDAWIRAQSRSATNIVLHFLPGVHSDVRIFIGGYRVPQIGTGPWSFTNLNVYVQGGDPDADPPTRPEDTTLVFPSDYYPESGNEGVIFVQYLDSVVKQESGRLTQARRVVVENLTLDGNWSHQRAYSDPGASGVFKMFGVNAAAATGRFRNLIVRNLGSHGLVPASQFDVLAGTEAFPIMVSAVDEGQEPAVDCDSCDLQLIPYGSESDPRPWLIEGCEVHGFNQSWGGYKTAIMVNAVNRSTTEAEQATWVNHLVHPAFFKDPQRRFALVRNCQVRGGAYAFGLAGGGWSTGSTFTGNAAVGAGGGYNADTHAVVAGDITNSAILDVGVGVRQVSEGFGTPDSINYHTVAGNLFRIGSRSTYRRYQDYRIAGGTPSGTVHVSDASLVLGYDFTNTVSCYHINGATVGPVFRDNWITTKAKEGFYTPNPVDLPSAVFRPLWWQTPTEVFPPYESGTFVRRDSQNVTLHNNRISSVADKFARMEPTLGDSVHPSFNSATATAYTADRSAIAGDPEFIVASRTERVVLFQDDSETVTYSWKSLSPNGSVSTVTDTRLEPRLTRVREVQIQKPWRYSSESMKVHVRLMDHWLPTSQAAADSESVPDETIHLRLVGPGIDQILSQTTGDVAQFTLPIAAGASGSYTLTAWWLEPGESDFNYHGAYSTARHDEGTVVTVAVSPDVANDRNTSFAAQRPVFSVRRSGPTTDPLTVNLELPAYTVPRFSSSKTLVSPTPDIAGTYGSGTGQDYVLKRGATTITPGALPNRAFTVTIAAGDSFTNITLYPTYDDLTENEVAYLRVAAGTGYAVGNESTALAFIYDGPEFVVKELQDYSYSSSYSAAYAINGDTLPKVAGVVYKSYNGYQTYTGWEGGWWTAPSWLSWSKLRSPTGVSSDAYPGQTPEPFGVADTQANQVWYVGSRWNGTRRVPWSGWQNSITYLGTLKPNGAGEALAIANHATDVRRIVGWTEHTYSSGGSTFTTTRRPTLWRGANSTAEDLGSLTSSEDKSIQGAALAVNSQGNIGGWSMKQFSNPTVLATRGFLIFSNRASISLNTDMRYPLGVDESHESQFLHSIVYGTEGATNACGVSHYKPTSGLYPTNAVAWRGSVMPKRLAVPEAPIGELVHSDAMFFTMPQYSGGQMRPVGRLWTNSVASAVAVFWNSDALVPALLSDPHFSQSSGWILRRPLGSNSSGWIVGEGTYNGIQRGFVMVRRN